MYKKQSNKRLRTAHRKGASVVELAITSPLFLLILLGVIDAGQFANCYQTISNASREGGRVAARSTTTRPAEVENSVMDYLTAAFPNVPTAELNQAVTVNVRDAAGAPLASLVTIPEGAALRVDVSMQFDSVRYFPGLDALNDWTIQVPTVMRRE